MPLDSRIVKMPETRRMIDDGRKMRFPTYSASLANVAIRAPSPVPLIRIANVWSVQAPPTQTTAESTWTNFRELYVLTTSWYTAREVVPPGDREVKPEPVAVESRRGDPASVPLRVHRVRELSVR